MHLGNRGAIDPLIATHGVIYNEPENVFLVNQGPGVSGRYLGYDLTRSFAERAPVRVREIEPDPAVSPETFRQVSEASKLSYQAGRQARKKRCELASGYLEKARALYPDSSDFNEALGDYSEHCLKDLAGARGAREKALALHIPYAGKREEMERRLRVER